MWDDDYEIPDFKPYTQNGFYYDGSEQQVWEAQEALEEAEAEGNKNQIAEARSHYNRCYRAWQHSLL